MLIFVDSKIKFNKNCYLNIQKSRNNIISVFHYIIEINIYTTLRPSKNKPIISIYHLFNDKIGVLRFYFQGFFFLRNNLDQF